MCNGYVYAVVARDASGKLYTFSGQERYGQKENIFSEEGKVILLNKKELPIFKYKSTIDIRPRFYTKKIKLKIEILKVTSKKFKRLFDLTIKDGCLYLKDKYKFDILLHKAMKYVK